MNTEAQAVYLNALPLLVLGLLYLAAAAALAPSLWRERRRIRELELTLALLFPAAGTAAVVFGALILSDREPVGDYPWLALAAVLVAALPVAVFFLRWRERGLVLTGMTRLREAEHVSSERERTREVLNAFTTDLARMDDLETIGRRLVETAVRLLQVDFSAPVRLEGTDAHGVYGQLEGRELPWWRELRLDLTEPSAVASAAYEAAPFAVYDVESSAAVNRRLAEQVGAKSGVWVPLITGEKVIGVLAVATTRERRTFSHDEVSLLQELAAETALAVDRVQSGMALGETLARERLVARISQKIRSELDLEAVLRVAVDESAAALRVSRCFIRLDDAVAADTGEPGQHELSTPIVIGGEAAGTFGLQRTGEAEWSDEEIALAEAVAHEVGIAVRTSRLLAENAHRLRRQASLIEAAHAVTGELELETVLQRLVDEVAELLGGDAADCYLLDPRRGVFRCAAVKGLPRTLVGYEFEAAGGLSGQALARGRAVIAAEYGSIRGPVPDPAYEGFASAIAAPIGWGDDVRGVLGVGSWERGSFDQADADVLEAFAGLASLALRNAEAFEERSRQARIQRGFYRIATVLGQPLSHAETLDAVAEAARDALGGAFAAVLIPRAGALEVAGSQDLPAPLGDALAGGLIQAETALATAAEQGRILASPDLGSDERFDSAWKELSERVGAHSLLAVPVQTVREDEGVALVLVFFAEERRFEDDDLELATHLGGAARGALERSALFEEERAARSLAQQLARTGALLATELDPEAVLEEVVRQAPSLVGVEACAIRVLEDEDLVLTAVEGEENPDDVIGARSPATVRLSGDVVQSRTPLAIEDAWSDERLPAVDPILALGYRGFLGVPLIAPEGAIHGVLAVYSRRPKAWRMDEIEALTALAANASAALSNAELYQRVALEKERSFAILANIADGIVAVDREGDVVLWNKAAEHITGVPAEEALGQKPFQVLGRSLESEGDAPPGDRLVPILRGGDEVWLSLTEAVMRDPAGAVAGRIFAFRDISAERLVEQMKSEFVSTVSEEIRRPLTSIYGFAETLLRRDVLFGEEERRTFLGYIASESERLTTIVDALLNVARLDVGDLQMNLVPTDVGSLVSDVVGALQQTSVNRHEFVVDLPAEPVAVEADPEKLRQVLQNLVDNAVKFSPGGGTVTVAARRRTETVEVSVADEGIGISPTEQDRIFRKFYRGDIAGGREGLGGTGLGLFIARGLVAAMGGRIWVTSREGEGSSFTFELPAAGVSEAPGERVRATGGR